MKRAFWLFCAVLLLLPTLGCSDSEETAKRYDYDLDEYVTIPDLMGIKAVCTDPAADVEKEVDEALFQVMLSHATFEKKDGGAVEKYNKVKYEFSMTADGKLQDKYSDDDREIIVGYEGNDASDYALGMALVGKKAGETANCEYTFPADDTDAGEFAGKTVTLTGKVLKIYQHSIPECTDEFIEKMENDGFKTVEDFRAYISNEILEARLRAKEVAVLEAYLAGVVVKKYPERELEEYEERYLAELDDMAAQLEMTRDEYAALYLGLKKGTVEEEARKDAENRVKNDLACIQGNRKMGTTLTEEEYQDGLVDYYAQHGTGFDTAEDFEAFYTKEIIYESVLWDKTFRIIVENAVCVESEQ